MGHREEISQHGAFNTASRRELKTNLQKKSCLTLEIKLVLFLTGYNRLQSLKKIYKNELLVRDRI